jgi:hypothetical protein
MVRALPLEPCADSHSIRCFIKHPALACRASAPGRIVHELRVPFARPRDPIQLKRDPRFGELAYALWQALKP